MRELLDCLNDWLVRNRGDASAYALFAALTGETLKRAGSADPAQREFDAEALAPAAGGPSDFDSAKRWIDRAKFELYAGARQTAIEQHFRAAGLSQALRVVRRSPRGKHRAVWFLEPYPLPSETEELDPVGSPQVPLSDEASLSIQYDFTPPGKVKAAWYARPLIGSGSFVTRSWRGLLWLALFLVPIAYLVFSSVVALAFTYSRRPLLTSDVASMLLLATLGWAVWRISVRPAMWLLALM